MKMIALTLAASLMVPVAFAQEDTFEQVFNQQRALYGKGHAFTYAGQPYTTDHPEEIEAMAEPTRANAEALITSAEAMRQESESLGYEWRDPARFLKQARTALSENEYQRAMDLAARAKYQARMSIAQYESVNASWQQAVPE
ncbi:hypothetical protein [Marinobacterium marinum]|uniref:DUF4148 domain-containing protein n=1 Tax=Marinobacterium marinum TaxID=2756129 RepID=A0A7W1WVW2_9GAMM|nr:hypothetical protein [Marinobacterium marinum]MBA4501189.1 hypothetical protein [Marinobacterium marinum]